MENREDRVLYFVRGDWSTIPCSLGFRPPHYQTDTLVLAQFPLGFTLAASCYSVKKMSSRLSTTLCGISLKTPVWAASGTYAYGVEFEKLTDLNALGGIVVKGLSREPMDGNAPPRMYETEAGMMNSIGLQNIGVRAFVAEKLPALRRFDTAIFANVFGYSVEDYLEVVRVLEDAEGIAAYELNVSCPNVKHGGIFFSSDCVLLAELVRMVRGKSKRPLIVKLSPNVARIDVVAKAAEEAGADAISLVNTFIALAIDAKARRSRLGNGFGGLSGPAIKPIALRMVYEAAQAVKIPIVGLGGIASGLDAAEFMIAGASAVEVGTANFWDPGAPVRIARELDRFLEEEKIASVKDLVGTLKLGTS
jgi:dihydroorotate dehydrogenase (NAD+) catalytic subunit